MKWRKKPAVVDAWPVDHLLADCGTNWKGLPQEVRDAYDKGGWVFGTNEIHIPTLEGTMIAGRTDFLIRGVKGEFYPCKRDIFLATYDQAEE